MNKYSLTPAHIAIIKRQKHATKFILEHNKTTTNKFDLTLPGGKYGFTVFHYAVAIMDMETLQELLMSNTNFLTIKDYLGRTARDLVKNCPTEKVFVKWHNSLLPAKKRKNTRSIVKSCVMNVVSSQVIETPRIFPALVNTVYHTISPTKHCDSPSDVTGVEKEAPLRVINLSNYDSFMEYKKMSLSNYTAKENCLLDKSMNFHELLINDKTQAKRVFTYYLQQTNTQYSLRLEIQYLLSLMKGEVEGKNVIRCKKVGSGKAIKPLSSKRKIIMKSHLCL